MWVGKPIKLYATLCSVFLCLATLSRNVEGGDAKQPLQEIEDQIKQLDTRFPMNKGISLAEYQNRLKEKAKILFTSENLNKHVKEKVVESGGLMRFETWNVVAEKANYLINMTTARRAPFCVFTSDKNLPPALFHFKNIFKDILNGKKVRIRKANGDTAVPNYVTSMEFTRMTTPQAGSYNLRQWFHITFKTEGLEGIYVQMIASPLGIPVGQFRIDFDCQDCGAEVTIPEALVVKCSQRPAVSTIHPTIYSVGGSMQLTKWPVRKEFHVHFNYADVLPDESTAFQMLVVAVKNFKKKQYDVFKSPVFVNYEMDSLDGLIYPWYIDSLKETFCHDGVASKEICSSKNPSHEREYCFKEDLRNKASSGSDVSEIPYNRDYDDCIASENVIGTICPPGPFAVSRTATDRASITKLRKELSLVTCSPCDEVSPTTDTVLNAEIEQPNKLQKSARNRNQPWGPDKYRRRPRGIDASTPSSPDAHNKRKAKYDRIVLQRIQYAELRIEAEHRSHGLSSVTAFVLLPLLAISIARCCKEMDNKPNTPWHHSIWLASHIILMVVSFMLAWHGLTFIDKTDPHDLCNVPNVNTTFDQVRTAMDGVKGFINSGTIESTLDDSCSQISLAVLHKVVGSFTFISFHVSLFTGAIRPVEFYRRRLLLYIHVISGYAALLLAYIAILISGSMNTIITSSAFIGVFVIINAVTTLLMKASDKANNVNPQRKLLPVPETLHYKGMKNPTFIAFIVTAVVFTLFAISILIYRTLEGFEQTFPVDDKGQLNVSTKMVTNILSRVQDYINIKDDLFKVDIDTPD